MKIRAILTIVISLLVGFILGFLTPGQIRKQEMKKKHRHSYSEVFIYRTLDIIKPSEAQKDSLIPIIEIYALKTMTLKNKVSSEFDSLRHQMNYELKPFITEKQYKILVEKTDGLNPKNRK